MTDQPSALVDSNEMLTIQHRSGVLIHLLPVVFSCLFLGCSEEHNATPADSESDGVITGPTGNEIAGPADNKIAEPTEQQAVGPVDNHVLLILCSTCQSYGQDPLPSDAAEAEASIPDVLAAERFMVTFRYQEGDFDPPKPGEVRGAEWRWLRYLNRCFAKDLAGLPIATTELTADFHKALTEWNAMGDRRLDTKTLDDLLDHILAGIGIYRDYARHAMEDAVVSQQIGVLSAYLEGMTSYAILALAPHLEATNGELSQKNVSQLLSMYANRLLVANVAPREDDDPWPVYSSGVFIADPVTAVEVLKAGDWAAAESLLLGFPDAETYFRTYRAEGQGLPLLKQKYAANQDLIHAKFDELKAWIEQQKQQQAERDR